VNAALISSLVRNPSASESAFLKKSETSCSVALGGRTFAGSVGCVSFFIGSGSTGVVSFLTGSTGVVSFLTGSTGVVSF
jgi:hypothetical protein